MSLLSITPNQGGAQLEFWVFQERQKTRWDSIDIDKEWARGLVCAIEEAMSGKTGEFATRDTNFSIRSKSLGGYYIEFEEIVRGPQIAQGAKEFTWATDLQARQLDEIYQTLKSIAL